MLHALLRGFLSATCVAFLAGCDDRAAESTLFGTWKAVSDDHTMEFSFASNHTYKLSFDGHLWQEGRWYAGGKNIYCRWEEPDRTQLVVWRIDDISSDEFRVRWDRDGKVFTFKRTG